MEDRGECGTPSERIQKSHRHDARIFADKTRGWDVNTRYEDVRGDYSKLGVRNEGGWRKERKKVCSFILEFAAMVS